MGNVTRLPVAAAKLASEVLRPLLVPIDSVQPHPRNPRQGDVGAVSQSLDTFGQTKPIVVQDGTGYVLAGNHTWRAAKALGWPSIAVVRVAMDDTKALAYAVADNRTQELGTTDSDVLASILTELAQAGELGGTGYDGDDVDSLLADLNGKTSTIGDAATDSVTEVWGVVIDLHSEQEQIELLTEMAGRGLAVRALMN